MSLKFGSKCPNEKMSKWQQLGTRKCCWNVEMLKCWNAEMLKCWNVEMLKCNPWDMPSNFTVYDCLSCCHVMLSCCQVMLSCCHMSNAYVDHWDMLNNFCFHVYAQKSLFMIFCHAVMLSYDMVPASPAGKRTRKLFFHPCPGQQFRQFRQILPSTS